MKTLVPDVNLKKYVFCCETYYGGEVTVEIEERVEWVKKPQKGSVPIKYEVDVDRVEKKLMRKGVKIDNGMRCSIRKVELKEVVPSEKELPTKNVWISILGYLFGSKDEEVYREPVKKTHSEIS